MRATQPGAKPAEVQVEVLRNFQNHRREILKQGSKATLPRLFALEMQAANKVRILPDEPKAADPPKPATDPTDPPKPAADKPKPGNKEK